MRHAPSCPPAPPPMPLLRLAVGLSSVLLASASLAAQAPASLRYDRDVRPILADKCFRCHGPDAKTRAAELRLDEREAAIGPRGDDPPAIVPGDPDASELWRRLARDDDDRMPPPDSGKPALTAAERDANFDYFNTEDYRIGYDAFIHKRKPRFAGR